MRLNAARVCLVEDRAANWEKMTFFFLFICFEKVYTFSKFRRRRRMRLSQGASLKPDESEAAPLSQSDFARLGLLTTLLPRFDPRR
jgi:hypothetical protein